MWKKAGTLKVPVVDPAKWTVRPTLVLAVASIQPRIRLSRSFDERSHSYLGYVLRLRGTLDGEAKEFVVAVGKGAHEKHQFHVGDHISGKSVSVSDTNLEIADVYKTSAPGHDVADLEPSSV